MSEKGNKFNVITMLLLLLTAAACSFFGICEENISDVARLTEQRQLHHDPETLAESLPYTPSATYRFSSRQTRTLSATSRVRSWTPADIKDKAELIIRNFPPSVCFDLPDNVQAVGTAYCLCTSPVRAGPEYIFT